MKQWSGRQRCNSSYEREQLAACPLLVAISPALGWVMVLLDGAKLARVIIQKGVPGKTVGCSNSSIYTLFRHFRVKYRIEGTRKNRGTPFY